MAAEDAPAIVALESQELSAWNDAQVREELELAASMQLVAWYGNIVIGWCCARHVGPEAELMKISVSAEYRRRKISTRLLECMEIQLLSAGVKCLFLDVRLQNSGAISFYHQAGFTELSRRIRYYTQPEDDALVFKKDMW